MFLIYKILAAACPFFFQVLTFCIEIKWHWSLQASLVISLSQKNNWAIWDNNENINSIPRTLELYYSRVPNKAYHSSPSNFSCLLPPYASSWLPCCEWYKDSVSSTTLIMSEVTNRWLSGDDIDNNSFGSLGKNITVNLRIRAIIRSLVGIANN